MKITKKQLRKIIREEKSRLLNETAPDDPYASVGGPDPSPQTSDPRRPSPMPWERENAGSDFAGTVWHAAREAGRTTLSPDRLKSFMQDLEDLFDTHGLNDGRD